MFMVATPSGFSFGCVELGDAVTLADTLAKDLDEEAVVVDDETNEVVYSTFK